MNNKYFYYKYTKVIVALVFALIISELLVKEVFLEYSPRIRPDLADVMVDRSLALINIDTYRSLFRNTEDTQPTDIAVVEKTNSLYKELDTLPFEETVIPGVYARETEGASEMQVNLDLVPWIQIPYTKKDGTVIMLNIPEGTEVPPPGLF